MVDVKSPVVPDAMFAIVAVSGGSDAYRRRLARAICPRIPRKGMAVGGIGTGVPHLKRPRAKIFDKVFAFDESERPFGVILEAFAAIPGSQAQHIFRQSRQIAVLAVIPKQAFDNLQPGFADVLVRQPITAVSIIAAARDS